MFYRYVIIQTKTLIDFYFMEAPCNIIANMWVEMKMKFIDLLIKDWNWQLYIAIMHRLLSCALYNLWLYTCCGQRIELLKDGRGGWNISDLHTVAIFKSIGHVAYQISAVYVLYRRCGCISPCMSLLQQ